MALIPAPTRNRPWLSLAEFGYFSWLSPQWQDSSDAVHVAVAREPALEAVRRIDFTGNVTSRLVALEAAER